MSSNHKRNTEGIKKYQFKKGQSGNPKGAPPKLPEITQLLDKTLGTEKDGLTDAERIINALISKAKSGDVRAAEVLMNRSYGMPKQGIDVKHSGETTTIIKRVIHSKKDSNN